MDRRTLLATVCGVGVATLAGCGADDGGSGTPAATDTPTQTVSMIDSEFTVDGTGSGQQTDDATVSVDGGTVTVEGTIWGADGCTTAELAGADYDAAADELTVAVATTDREPTGTEAIACTQAIVEIAYTATVTFDSGLPGTVVVTHDHGDGPEAVTTASP